MVSTAKLDHLIEKATRKSEWQDAHVDVAGVAHAARVQHAVETLVQLGHDQLAGELLRLERGSDRPSVGRAEFPPAA